MRYDEQAFAFDERAAVPDAAARCVADVLGDMVSLVPGQRWLELGPGTGSLSLHLIRRGITYVGLDQSQVMVDVFQAKLDGEGLVADLVYGDGDGPWPVADGGIEVVFSARASHHLDIGHVANEVLRVASPRGTRVVFGRVTRPRDSVRSVMRRRMRELLEESGYRGRDHLAHRETLIGELEHEGAEPLGTRIAATWSRSRSPAESLRDWESKTGLAGVDVSDQLKASILAELRAWAARRYHDLESALEQEESFELSGVLVKDAGPA